MLRTAWSRSALFCRVPHGFAGTEIIIKNRGVLKRPGEISFKYNCSPSPNENGMKVPHNAILASCIYN